VGILQAADRDYTYRQRVRNHQIQNYMYGQKIKIPNRCDNGEGSYLFQHEPTSDLSLAPSSTVVSFGDITIYRIGGGKEFHAFFFFSFEPVFFLPRTHISVGIVHRINHVSRSMYYCNLSLDQSYTPVLNFPVAVH